MPGYQRLDRHVFDGIGTGTDPTTAGGDEAPYGVRFTGYATWASSASQTATFKGSDIALRHNGTQAAGSVVLSGTGSNTMRMSMVVGLGATYTTNTAVVRAGLIYRADPSSGGKGVFIGLAVDANGANRRWSIGIDSGAGYVELTSIAATSLTANNTAGIQVDTDATGNVVTVQTPDGGLSANLSAQSGLGTSYGLRMLSGSSATLANTAGVTACDFLIYNAAFTAVNDSWDRTKLLPNWTLLKTFGMGSEALVAGGPTPTWDPGDYLGGDGVAQSLVQSGSGSSRIDLTFASPLNLTNKCLAIIAKFDFPDQYQYKVGALASSVTFNGSTPQNVVFSTDPGLNTGGGSFDVVPDQGAVVYYTAYNPATKTASGCLLDKTGAHIVDGLGTDSATYTTGTKIASHGSGTGSPGTLNISIATDQTNFNAGNYILLKPLSVQQVGWMISTFLVKGNLDYNSGWEGRINGTPPSLASIGYIRLAISGVTTPFTSAANGSQYDGPQPTSVGPTVKWNSVGVFDKVVGQPRIAFTFDDSHDTDWFVVAGELEKPRRGFPNGHRGTFHTIDTNVNTSQFSQAEWLKRLSAAGHEISMHCNTKAFHADEQDTFVGHGPMGHSETIRPGSAVADLTAQWNYFLSLGIPAPYTFAWPHGQGVGNNVNSFANAQGILCHRSLSGGGTGVGTTLDAYGRIPSLDLSSLTTRFTTNPMGDPGRIPGEAWSKDIVATTKSVTFTLNSNQATVVGLDNSYAGYDIQNVNFLPDNTKILSVSGTTITMSAQATATGTSSTVAIGDRKGQRGAERSILDCCMQDGMHVFVTHQVYETGVAPLFSGSWNRDQLSEVLEYVSDLALGQNVTGLNPELRSYPGLRVITLFEMVTGSPPSRAVPESAGCAF